MKKYLNKQGISLIEIILSIAIFGIIAVSLIPMFTYSFIQIHRSGDKTEALYDIQKSIETSDIINPTQDTLTIIFGSRDIDIPVNVFEVEEAYDEGGSKASVVFFEASLENL